MNYGPCLCGAYDCPRCFPGSTDIVECALCEKSVRRYTLQETKGGRLLCEECYEQYERDGQMKSAEKMSSKGARMSVVDLSKCKSGDVVLLRNHKVAILAVNEGNDIDKYPFAHDSGGHLWHAVDIKGKSCIHDIENDVIDILRTDLPGEILTCEPSIPLRDVFACHEVVKDDNYPSALKAALAGPPPSGGWQTNPEQWMRWEADWRARIRYIRADAMLKARTK